MSVEDVAELVSLKLLREDEGRDDVNRGSFEGILSANERCHPPTSDHH